MKKDPTPYVRAFAIAYTGAIALAVGALAGFVASTIADRNGVITWWLL